MFQIYVGQLSFLVGYLRYTHDKPDPVCQSSACEGDTDPDCYFKGTLLICPCDNGWTSKFCYIGRPEQGDIKVSRALASTNVIFCFLHAIL